MGGAAGRYYIPLTISLLLFITGYFLQDYFRTSPLNYSIKLSAYRNGLFVGFPFVFLGYLIKEKEAKLQQLKNRYVLYAATFGLIALLTESGFAKLSMNHNDILLSLIVLCPALFILILKYSRYGDNDGYIGKLASGIFFVHILIWEIITVTFDFQSESRIIILPVILFLSMLVSTGIIELNKRIRLFL
jgi:hypothetical protein